MSILERALKNKNYQKQWLEHRRYWSYLVTNVTLYCHWNNVYRGFFSMFLKMLKVCLLVYVWKAERKRENLTFSRYLWELGLGWPGLRLAGAQGCQGPRILSHHLLHLPGRPLVEAGWQAEAAVILRLWQEMQAAQPLHYKACPSTVIFFFKHQFLQLDYYYFYLVEVLYC